jgi:AcrR family transcriptional regulator
MAQPDSQPRRRVSPPDPEPRRRAPQARVAESAERLLQAALSLIAEQGFERTTAAQIGERAGLSREMVRVRYGSKEALLEKLLLNPYAARLLPPRGLKSGVEPLLAWVDLLRERARDDEPVLRAYFILLFEGCGPLPAARPWGNEWYENSRDFAETALRAGQAEGTVRTDVDAADEAAQYVACGVGMAFHWVISGDTATFRRGLAGLGARVLALRAP